MKILNKYSNDLKAWPFVEAIKIIKRFGGLSNFNLNSKDCIIFETGYGPSGLPHIGTFGEIVRTLMVQNALHSLVDCKSKFITFSDDMDGLRTIPDNVPTTNTITETESPINIDKRAPYITLLSTSRPYRSVPSQ